MLFIVSLLLFLSLLLFFISKKNEENLFKKTCFFILLLSFVNDFTIDDFFSYAAYRICTSTEKIIHKLTETFCICAPLSDTQRMPEKAICRDNKQPDWAIS